MSRIWVSNDAGTVTAEVFIDDTEGNASAVCSLGDWASDPDRADQLRDVVEEAGIHMDLHH